MRSSFAKPAVFFAIGLVVGIGMCGLSFELPSSDSEFHTNFVGGLSLMVMAISVFGLLATLFAIVANAIYEAFSPKKGHTPKLFDDDKDR